MLVQIINIILFMQLLPSKITSRTLEYLVLFSFCSSSQLELTTKADIPKIKLWLHSIFLVVSLTHSILIQF